VLQYVQCYDGIKGILPKPTPGRGIWKCEFLHDYAGCAIESVPQGIPVVGIHVGKDKQVRPTIQNQARHVPDSGAHLTYPTAKIGSDPAVLPSIVPGRRTHRLKSLGSRPIGGPDTHELTRPWTPALGDSREPGEEPHTRR
jgi:hypothetical protein